MARYSWPESLYRRLRFCPPMTMPTGCIEYTGASAGQGYGCVSVNGKGERAHRAVYELLVGPIPEGLVLDHLCRNRACVNPSHLEPVTNHENILRGVGPTAINATKTHCPNGHEYTPENTVNRKDRPGRFCRICRNTRAYEPNKRARERRRGEAA